MCFFKHLNVIQNWFDANDKNIHTQDQQSLNTDGDQEIFTRNTQNSSQMKANSYSNCLMSLLKLLQSNYYSINYLKNKMAIQNQILEKNHEDQHSNNEVQKQRFKVQEEKIFHKLFCDLSPDYLTNSFQFKLVLEHNMPNKLYKHRKYSLGIKLIPLQLRSSKITVNSNPLNVCMSIFDKDGNWVYENQLGEPILLGITQVSLYEGKAQFPRLLFNQISSNLPKQKLNIAIFVKPGNFRDELHGSHNIVKWNSIKPLILKNVLVLSKKRKQHLQNIL